MSDQTLRTPFPERASAALKDTFLQQALGIATTKFIGLRQESFAGFPEGEALRDRARAVKEAFDADGVTVVQFNEPASGQTVFHLHFHVIPRHDGVPLMPHGRNMEKPEVLAAHAEKIRKALKP